MFSLLTKLGMDHSRVDQEACAQHHDGQRHGCMWRDWLAHGMLEIAGEERLEKIVTCKMTDSQRKWCGRVVCQQNRE